MTKFTTKITDHAGLHARPTSIMVSAASKFVSEIIIETNGKSGNLKSIMNIMALGIKQGDEITVISTGKDEKEATSCIQTIMKENNLI